MSAEPRRVLVVDDDPIVRESLCEFLTLEGYAASQAESASEALELLARADRGDQGGPFSLVMTDQAMPGQTGTDLLREVSKRHRGVAVIILTGYGTIESAVEALRLGAADYLTKPVVDAELRMALERALQQHALRRENVALRARTRAAAGLEHIVGNDPRMHRIFEMVEAVAAGRTTVLMSGESGTGKSLIARAIHERSARRDKPFVEISCGSIPETLLESELFGHIKGAFTGAHADKVGRFLAANGGTIFLDEINSASAGMQLKLLRVLQERKFEPVGSTQTTEVDVRVILASNQPLESLVAQGLFRQDLYYRINVVKIELPPLRDRTADVPVLAARFLERFSAELGKQIVGFSPQARAVLSAYSYPGNVRELQNIIERAAVMCKGQVVEADDLPPQITGEQRAGVPDGPKSDPDSADAYSPLTLEDAMRDPERRIILRALKANHWNRQKTADDLGINRTTLYKKMKAYGLDRPDDRVAG